MDNRTNVIVLHQLQLVLLATVGDDGRLQCLARKRLVGFPCSGFLRAGSLALVSLCWLILCARLLLAQCRFGKIVCIGLRYSMEIFGPVMVPWRGSDFVLSRSVRATPFQRDDRWRHGGILRWVKNEPQRL
jgi:hypothetical protein